MRASSVFGTAFFGLLCATGVWSAPVKFARSRHNHSGNAGDNKGPGSSGDDSSPSTSGGGGGGRGGGVLPAPRYVIYNDQAEPAPDPSKIKGFNVLALAFLLSSGKGGDVAGAWENLSDDQRTGFKKQYQDAGIKIIVSAFGETEKPTTDGKDPAQLASDMADWVKKYDVDGIDVDYEDFDAINGQGVDWLVTFTQTLRDKLPQGQYILTHAPVAPWFSKDGPYLKLHQKVGNLIDWYNLQFYNQGDNVYNTCDNLITQSSPDNPALLEIAANGVPMDMLVVGKPGAAGDANNGYIAPEELGKCLNMAVQKGWNAGAMSWEYPTANAQWIQSVISGSSLGSGSAGGNGTHSGSDDGDNGMNSGNGGNGPDSPSDGGDNGMNSGNGGNNSPSDGGDNGTNSGNGGNGGNGPDSSSNGGDNGMNSGNGGNNSPSDGGGNGTNSGNGGNGGNGPDSSSNGGDNGTNSGNGGNGPDSPSDGGDNGMNSGNGGNNSPSSDGNNGMNSGNGGSGTGSPSDGGDNGMNSGNGPDSPSDGGDNGMNSGNGGNGNNSPSNGGDNGTNSGNGGNGTDSPSNGGDNGMNSGNGGNGTDSPSSDGNNGNTANGGNGDNGDNGTNSASDPSPTSDPSHSDSHSHYHDKPKPEGSEPN